MIPPGFKASCVMCHRDLENPITVEIGIGAKCQDKLRSDRYSPKQREIIEERAANYRARLQQAREAAHPSRLVTSETTQGLR